MTSVIQNSSPVDVVKAFIACVRAKDVEFMRKLIHPKATACLIRENEPRFQTLTEAIDTLEKAEQELVEVSWDEVEHVDGEYATVWAAFSIHRDGVATSSIGFENILVLEEPAFGLGHPDYVRCCKITKMIYHASDSLHEQGIELMLSGDRKHKPSQVRIISIPHPTTPDAVCNPSIPY